MSAEGYIICYSALSPGPSTTKQQMSSSAIFVLNIINYGECC